jgi:phosphoribosylformylglycinamidine cyclo-ligase
MCVNDVVCQGATPLFFLDYIATGSLNPDQVAEVVGGVAEGCVQAGCAIIGGETAEMPGFYPDGEYDLAGFCVGLVDRSRIIDGSSIQPGDVLIGLGSTGVHSNGFSLVRKLVGQSTERLNLYVEELGMSLGQALLTPTRIYVKSVLALAERYRIKGAAHITGGGFIENIPRMVPKGMQASIRPGSWDIPPIFGLLQNLGDLSMHSMYNTFNMGIGMVLAVPRDTAGEVVRAAQDLGEKAYIIGSVTDKEGFVLCR